MISSNDWFSRALEQFPRSIAQDLFLSLPLSTPNLPLATNTNTNTKHQTPTQTKTSQTLSKSSLVIRQQSGTHNLESTNPPYQVLETKTIPRLSSSFWLFFYSWLAIHFSRPLSLYSVRDSRCSFSLVRVPWTARLHRLSATIRQISTLPWSGLAGSAIQYSTGGEILP